MLEALGSDQSLNLGAAHRRISYNSFFLQMPSGLRLGVRLGSLLLGLNLSADDKLADVVFLGQVEESSDLGSSLGTKALGLNGVGETGDV